LKTVYIIAIDKINTTLFDKAFNKAWLRSDVSARRNETGRRTHTRRRRRKWSYYTLWWSRQPVTVKRDGAAIDLTGVVLAVTCPLLFSLVTYHVSLVSRQ